MDLKTPININFCRNWDTLHDPPRNKTLIESGFFKLIPFDVAMITNINNSFYIIGNYYLKVIWYLVNKNQSRVGAHLNNPLYLFGTSLLVRHLKSVHEISHTDWSCILPDLQAHFWCLMKTGTKKVEGAIETRPIPTFKSRQLCRIYCLTNYF